jgi:hypothetical protein
MSAENPKPQTSPSSNPTMPETPGWQAEVTQTEWAILRLVFTLGLPALANYARRRYVASRKRKHQHEAMLDGWQKVQEQITPAAEDQANLRALTEASAAEARTARLRIQSQEHRMTSIECRMDVMESTANARHLELLNRLDALNGIPAPSVTSVTQ